jgi:hypothetical protein
MAPAAGIQTHAAAMIALAIVGVALAPRLGRGGRAGS